ncbi:hypothetical protein [Candidatus Poriferisocius sp.]|uniref:hypothetical protein n=1 Tax=Candidatus Poriferisocius sp. TaxID=3101276 RepID=UPI003B519483
MKSVLPKLDFEYEHFGRSWAKPLIPSVQVGGRATPWTVAHELGHVMDRSYPVPGLPGELSRAMANHTEDVTRGYGPEMAMANMSHASKPSERVASLWADYWTDPRRTGDFAQRADSTLQAGHGWDPRNIVKTRAAFQRRK